MLISATLEGVALLFLLVATGFFTALRLKKSRRRKVVTLSLAAAILTLVAALVVTLGGVAQEKAGIDLHLPGSLRVKAAIWVKAHENMQPDRSKVGDNLRIVSDAMTFLRQHESSLPAEARMQMGEYGRLSPKIDHVLSLAEEARYYEAAAGSVELIKSLAASPNDAATTGTTSSAESGKAND